MCLSFHFICVMESCFLAVILLSSFAVNACHLGITDWDDVVVAREDMPTTLVCTDTTVSGAVTINWMVKSLGADEWKLVLSASEKDQFYGGASKSDMQLADPKFHDTGVFSLSLLAKLEDRGLYSCLIKQQERQLKERKILLAILKVSVVPAAPVPLYSTLRLIASINPDDVVTKISWAAPGGVSMKSEKWPGTGTVAKLPEVRSSDNGVYACTVHLWGNCSSSSFTFDVNVTVDAHKLASFTNITHGLDISATQAQTSCPLTCPSVPGDYVVVRWRPPDIRKNSSMRIVHQYDRWRGSTLLTEQRRLQLAGPPYNADTGSFSYLLIPEIKDGGLYVCTVYLNDVAISKMTLLSVLKVRTRRLPSKLELLCQYSEHIQVQSASWKYQNRSRQLRMSSNGPGSVTTSVSLPITRDTAGNYTCTLTLKNGQTIWATQVVTLASEELVSATTSSLLPSLSALLLLVPLVAAGVLLWRQKHISDRGIQQSLSVHSGEVENIYENPEDIRQAPPQGSVYMDLKPRGEDDVYKELERYEQCHN